MQGKQLKSEHSQPIEQICEPIKVEQNIMPKDIIKQLMNRGEFESTNILNMIKRILCSQENDKIAL